MSTTFHAYGASSPRAPLEPLSFDPGELRPGEVEIQVSHCGICHSDLSMLDNEWGWSTFPFVPGHEAIGTVVALGEEAKGLKIGQRVGVGWFAHSRLSCYECLSGDHHLCTRGQGTMMGRHGGFADRLRVLGEALANAIVHGNRCDPEKMVHVFVAVNEHGDLLVSVKDSGSGFDPSRLPNPTAPANLFAPHGRGIFLIRQLMDEVHFKFDHGAELRMRRRKK
jgi:threonine dehydrogenase-like Zn-dependent dehydrogenase